MRQLLLDIAPAPPPTFDNFVAGRNAELVAALCALARGEGERFIYLWGEPGSGRSHLLGALVAARVRAGGPALRVGDGMPIPPPEAAGGLIAVDDADRLDATRQSALFNLFNALRMGSGMLVASGEAPPRQLKLRADLVTRLAAGLVYQVHGLTDTEKASALQAHAAARGFALGDDVVQYLLRHTRRDLPSLIALLDALDRHSLATKRAITVPLLKALTAGG